MRLRSCESTTTPSRPNNKGGDAGTNGAAVARISQWSVQVTNGPQANAAFIIVVNPQNACLGHHSSGPKGKSCKMDRHLHAEPRRDGGN
jgi:hypothetical protein